MFAKGEEKNGEKMETSTKREEVNDYCSRFQN